METQAYFSGIREKIIEQLGAATDTVLVAVAWLTDRALFDALVACQRRGVAVSLAVPDDRLNRKSSIAWERLTALGDRLWRFAEKLRFSASFSIALVAWGGQCNAAWVITNTSNASTHFSEPTTLSRVASKVKIWEMFDLKQPEIHEGKKFRSIKLQVEYDCLDRAMRRLYFVLHQEQMGRGSSIAGFASDQNLFTPIPPDSIAHDAFLIACGSNGSIQ